MRRLLLTFLFIFISASAYAKSYICRSDGSVVAFESGEETQLVKPLRQNEIEEMPIKPRTEAPAIEKEPEQKRSDFVPLTQKEVLER